ncbi:Cytochrome c [Noviherbaspirillum humi]|uniref:Cytochrome c n=1 Tax=Noviherbaspirillum humi TaxID=1688639 RepID=A0A239BVK9_9BURK|nr:c-type cytochrome [Noviherbaspirillum humi]SNS11709.1 Cytochrome c [Noviherbaspirillum humi]
MQGFACSRALLFAIAAATLPVAAHSADGAGDKTPAARKSADGKYIDRGRYLVRTAGCNDCHTPGYPQSGGKVPEEKWLTGEHVGWRGPWGTTYAANLRLYMNGIDENQWIKIGHGKELRPPMPWFALRDMTEDDLRAIYRYVRSLGPAGAPAPAYVPPDQTPQGPYVQFPMPPK